MAGRLDLDPDAELPAFMAAVAARAIASTSFTAHYGPAPDLNRIAELFGGPI